MKKSILDMAGRTRLLLCGFILIQSIRDVFFFDQFQSVSPWALIVIAIGPVSVGFLAWTLYAQPDQAKLLLRNWRPVLFVNFTTVLGWCAYLWALTMVEPAAVVLIHEAISPLVALACARLGLTREGWNSRQLPGAVLLALVALFVVWITMTGRGGLDSLNPTMLWPYLLLAALSAVLMTASLVGTRRLNESGLSTISVMGSRFLLLWVFAFALLGQWPTAKPELITAGLLALPLTLLPILLLQQAISKGGASKAVIGSAFLPPAVWLLQALDDRLTATPWMAAAMILFFVLLLWTALVGTRDKKDPPDDRTC